jgi:hypothetical protein
MINTAMPIKDVNRILRTQKKRKFHFLLEASLNVDKKKNGVRVYIKLGRGYSRSRK